MNNPIVVYKALSIRRATLLAVLTLAVALVPSGVSQAQLPAQDARASRLIDADHFELRIKVPETVEELENRREELRQKFLLTNGLWPMPAKCEMNPVIFDEKLGDGFRVAKVYFESLPGYYVTGNLYRPATGDGPFPAVVCPHGHWTFGRLTNGETGSIPGRCIDLAKMGFVVISIDMVGFNDNIQLPHDHNKSRAQMKADKQLPYEPRAFRGVFDFPRARLYGLSLAGLHVWNAIRAVDFLTALPEVDDERIGATGASGGASQTLFLMAADPRLKAAAPVNIVGAAKHPGCRCENAPGGWVDISTVEIAGIFAPRPLIMLSATEDPWTNSFPTRELPIIKRYYELYGAADKVKNVHIEGGHNYNAASRSAVYEWFAEHLQSSKPAIKDVRSPIPGLAALGDLRVFPDKILPDSAKRGLEVINDWIVASEEKLESSLPKNRAQLDGFCSEYGSNLRRLLQAEVPSSDEVTIKKMDSSVLGGITHEKLVVGRSGAGERFLLELVNSSPNPKGTLVLARPEWRGGMFKPGGGGIKPALKNLAVRDYRIIRVGGFASGELMIPRRTWETFSWPEAYNRSNQLEGIQDILTALVAVQKQWPDQPVILAGLGESGLLAAFAAAVYGRCEQVFIDLHRTDPGSDSELQDLLPVGSIKRVGDFRTAMLMLMRGQISLYNASPTFDGQWYRDQAVRLGLAGNIDFRLDEQLNWLNGNL
jgi:dienelactone hydrolase